MCGDASQARPYMRDALQQSIYGENPPPASLLLLTPDLRLSLKGRMRDPGPTGGRGVGLGASQCPRLRSCLSFHNHRTYLVPKRFLEHIITDLLPDMR